MMRLLTSHNSRLDLFGGAEDANIDQTLDSEDVKNEKLEVLIFLHPSFANRILVMRIVFFPTIPKKCEALKRSEIRHVRLKKA